MKIDENRRKSEKIKENPWKSMRIDENRSKSMKIEENQWKSKQIYTNIHKYTQIYENLCKSMQIYPNIYKYVNKYTNIYKNMEWTVWTVAWTWQTRVVVHAMASATALQWQWGSRHVTLPMLEYWRGEATWYIPYTRV